MWWRKKRNPEIQESAKSTTVFFKGYTRGIKYLFSVTMIPRVESSGRMDGGIWSGNYAMVTLLNLTRKSYFLPVGGPPLGWEYIAEKYDLDDEEAMGFTEIIGRVLGREVRLPDKKAKMFLWLPLNARGGTCSNE